MCDYRLTCIVRAPSMNISMGRRNPQHQRLLFLLSLLLSLHLRHLFLRRHPLQHCWICMDRCLGLSIRANRSLFRTCIDCPYTWRWIHLSRLHRPIFSRSHGQEPNPQLIGGGGEPSGAGAGAREDAAVDEDLIADLATTNWGPWADLGQSSTWS